MLDIEHPRQQGTTTRPVEMLPMQKKIITTNVYVKNFDFYNENNFCLIDRENPVVDEKFFETDYLPASEEVIKNVDAVLVLNFNKEKNGIIYNNYIGGATFLEMYDAFRYNKKIFLYNDIPQGILHDEIVGFSPTIINGNLKNIK